MIAIIAEEFIATQRIGMLTLVFNEIVITYRSERIIEQVTIEITIIVHVKKSSMGRQPFIVQAVLFCFSSKSDDAAGVMIINIQFIAPVLSFHIARLANINIQPSIAIY